jgi:hypothetical protein
LAKHCIFGKNSKLMNEPQNETQVNFQDILRISTVFGLIVLTFDFIQQAFASDVFLENDSFWANLKFLIMAVGVYYSLQWFHLKNPRTHFLRYFLFIENVALLVSIFDIFYVMYYFNLYKPEAKQAVVDLIYKTNTALANMGPEAKEITLENFNLIIAFSLIFEYILLFLFFSVFYVLFLKLFVKPKKF